MSTIESKFNGYPAVTDWDKAIFLLQQANSEGFNGATKKEIFQELFGDVVIQGAGYEDLPVAESSDPVPLPIPEADQRFGFLANGKYSQPNGPTLEYSATQWGLVLFDNEKWIKKFTFTLPRGGDGLNGKTIEKYNPSRSFAAGDQPVQDNIVYQVKEGESLPIGQYPKNNPSKVDIILDAGQPFSSSESTANNVDESGIKDGYYNNSGVFVPSSSAKSGNPIPVVQGDVLNSFFKGTGLNTTQAFDSVLLNSAGGFISKVSLSASYTVNDPNVAFVIPVFYPITDFTTAFSRMVFKNRDMRTTDRYLPYADPKIAKVSDNTSVNKKVYSGLENKLRTGPANELTLSNGYVKPDTGDYVNSSSVRSSWYLKVEYGKTYVTNGDVGGTYGAVFKDDFSYKGSITTQLINNARKTITIKDTDVKYIRVTFIGLSPWDSLYFGEGFDLPTDLKNTNPYSIYKLYDYEYLKKMLLLYLWKAVFLGDSNVAGYSTSPATSYVRIIKETYYVDTINAGVTGTRITAVGNPGDSSYDNSMVIRAAALPNTYDIYILDGGINDAGNTSPLGTMDSRDVRTYYGAIHTLLIDWITRCKGKKIGVITPPNLYNTYRTALIEVANYYGVPVFDCTTSFYATKRVPVMSTEYYPDGLHLSNISHQIKARLIYDWLLTL